MAEILLFVLDLAAIGLLGIAARKISALNYSPIVRGILGAAIGFGVELVRLWIGLPILNAFQVSESNTLAMFLANLRFFNIPVLMGVGFFLAYSGTETSGTTNPPN